MKPNKFNLCVLPTQMGKTFVIINRIKENLLNDGARGRSLHIVFTMNTLLNNRQFSNRLGCFNDTYGSKTICVFTSLYKGPYVHINNTQKLNNLFAHTTENCEEDGNKMPRILIACSNNIRFRNCFEFVSKLARENTEVKRVFIYFDELHKYISNSKFNIRNNIEEINNLPIVSGLYGMTASPNNLWSVNSVGYWSKIKIINISDQYYDDNYIGVNDIAFVCDSRDARDARDAHGAPSHVKGEFRENERFTIDFIVKTLKNYPDILSDNSRVFIPVNVRRKTHNYVRDHVFTVRPESIIITLNGVDKHIQYCNADNEFTTIPIAFNKGELGDLIADHIDQNGLKGRPIVFIGFNCVGMGQTLVSEKLGNFTSAIFGYNSILNDKMYQLFGRITGRFRDWEKYEKTTVYTTKMCKHISYIMEKCAKNIAINHNDKLLDNAKYLEPFDDTADLKFLKKNFGARDYEYIEWKEPIDSIEEADKILSIIFNDKIVVGDFLNIDGYYLSKNLRKYYKKECNNLTIDDRLTIDKYVKIKTSPNSYISNESRKYKYILLPVYDSLDSKDAKYYLQYSSIEAIAKAQ